MILVGIYGLEESPGLGKLGIIYLILSKIVKIFEKHFIIYQQKRLNVLVLMEVQ